MDISQDTYQGTLLAAANGSADANRLSALISANKNLKELGKDLPALVSGRLLPIPPFH
jgi:hypothetical protein